MPLSGSDRPLHTFTSHIAGRNAKVSIYNDRVEWTHPNTLSAGKLTAGVLTAGVSLLGTGISKRNGAKEMIPVRSISSVSSKRDGMLNSAVSVFASGNTIDFRVSHAEARLISNILMDLINGRDPRLSMPSEFAAASQTQQSAPAPVSSPSVPVEPTTSPYSQSGSSTVDELQKLAALKAQGILTEEEFAAAKSRLLGL